MGRLNRYNQLVRGISPHYTNVVVQPRGFPIFTDPLLKGQVRFARKTGAEFALINPDNEIALATAAPRNTSTLLLDRPNRWLEIGAVISIGPDIEFAVVKDFGDDFITLEDPITGDFQEDDTVELFATPLEPALPAPAGADTIVVRSRYHILAGDKISVETTPDLLTSLFDIRVSKARLLDVVDTFAPFSQFWELQLEERLPIDVALNDESLYLKAQPSYLSLQVFVPTVPNQPDDIGPFLLDYVSGVLFDRETVEEQLSVTVFDKLGNVIIDDNGSPLAVDKQFQITEMPVMADAILLWNVADGTVTFGKRGNTQEISAILECDDRGQFQTTQEVVPPMPPGTEWSIPVQASKPVTIRVGFQPNGFRDFEIEALTPSNIVIGTTADDELTERIDIVIIGQPGTQVTFGNWVPTKNQAFSYVYGITADVFGEAQWQGTNVFNKPMFLNFAMGLKGRYDSTRTPNRFDGGMLYL